jgi:uncharacterized protein (DUF2062 family)
VNISRLSVALDAVFVVPPSVRAAAMMTDSDARYMSVHVHMHVHVNEYEYVWLPVSECLCICLVSACALPVTLSI